MELIVVNIIFLFPLERRKPDYVDCDYAKRNKVREDCLHPVFDFETFALVCFLHEFFPAQAEFAAAAENRENQRAERKKVVAYDKIPEIKPCRAFAERVKMKHAVA